MRVIKLEKSRKYLDTIWWNEQIEIFSWEGFSINNITNENVYEDDLREKFLEQLSQITSIYNFMALLLSCIFLDERSQRVDFDEIELDNYIDEQECLDAYWVNKDVNGEMSAISELRKTFSDVIKEQFSIEQCFATICMLDGKLDMESVSDIFGKAGIVEYRGLNTQFWDKVRIFPLYITSAYEKSVVQQIDGKEVLRKKREKEGTVVSQYLLHHVVLDEALIKDYATVGYFVPENSLVSECELKDGFTVMMTPLSNEKMDDTFCYKMSSKTFEIEGIKEEVEKDLINRSNAAYQQAVKKKVNILIYPEMLFSLTVYDNLKVLSDDLPMLIVNGSMWRNMYNESKITLNMNKTRKEISYYKKNPYGFTDKKTGKIYKEHLRKDDVSAPFLFIDIQGFGRISIGICSDVLDPKVQMFHRIMQTNILLVPAYTPSMDLRADIEALTNRTHCCVIVNNACSLVVDKDDDRISFITVPGMYMTDRKADRKAYTYYINKSSCEDHCKETVCGRTLKIYLNEFKIYENGVRSFKIEEV